MHYTFLYLVLFFLATFPFSLKAIFDSQFVIGAYYSNDSQYRIPIGNRSPFNLDMIDSDLITDLYFAFATFGYITNEISPNQAHLTGNYLVQPTMKDDISQLYPQLIQLKNKNKNFRTILSFGGWNFNNPENQEGKLTYRLFSQMVSKQENRKQFIDSVIEYVHRYRFNGIDIDWEYPGDLTRGGSLEDYSNFSLFLKECSHAFRSTNPPLILSWTVPSFVPYSMKEQFKNDPDRFFKWVAESSKDVDRINVMAYDYHGSFDIPKKTGVNSPLNQDTDKSSTLYIAKTLQDYLKNGVPSNKLILVLPIFGRTYGGVDFSGRNYGPGNIFETAGSSGKSTKEKGLLAYYEIADMIQLKQFTFGSDLITSTVYGFNLATKEWVSFDNPDTIRQKAKLAKELKLGGILFWTIDMDEYQWEPKFPNIRSVINIGK